MMINGLVILKYAKKVGNIIHRSSIACKIKESRKNNLRGVYGKSHNCYRSFYFDIL